MPQPEDAGLKRVYIFEPHGCCECEQRFYQAAQGAARCRHAAQQGAHMLRRVIERPGFEIDRLPLVPAHFGMRGTDMLDVVPVEVRLHRDALLPEDLMIL